MNRYYVTVGVKYSQEPHPYLPGWASDPDGVIEIYAPNYEDARSLIVYFAKNEWAFIYEWDEVGPNPYFYPRGSIAIIRHIDGHPTMRPNNSYYCTCDGATPHLQAPEKNKVTNV